MVAYVIWVCYLELGSFSGMVNVTVDLVSVGLEAMKFTTKTNVTGGTHFVQISSVITLKHQFTTPDSLPVRRLSASISCCLYSLVELA